MPEAQVRNDEPTKYDKLGREGYAKGLANVALGCDTPLVVGLYGRWGIGKTSLLELIRQKLEESNDVKTVWFNAWEHQFDDHPALALLHTMIEQLGLSKNKSMEKMLSTIIRAISGLVLKATTPLNVDDIEKTLEAYEKQNFLVQEARVQLRNHFGVIVRETLERNNRKRIVFFIDDLDRCLSEHILTVLEALKLYFNLPGCIYFLAVDRAELEASIKHHYEETELDGVRYLEKIVQLPFNIPPIEPYALKSYISSILPTEFESCVKILNAGLARNPRTVKRFINTLILNYNLAQETISQPRPDVLAALLLVQYHSPSLYSKLVTQPEIIIDLAQEFEGEDELEFVEQLLEVFSIVDLPEIDEVRKYIFLTRIASFNPDPKNKGFYAKQELDNVLVESGLLDAGEKVREHFQLFKTPRQHTWLVTTNRYLYCLLDDTNTREKGSVVQFKMELGQLKLEKVKAYQLDNGKDVLDLGRRKSWLYSKDLYPDPTKLEEEIRRLIQDARVSSLESTVETV